MGATLQEFCCPIKIGVDAHRPYLENAKSGEFIKINFTAERISKLFLPNSIDCVTLIDVIEHFENGKDAEAIDALLAWKDCRR